MPIFHRIPMTVSVLNYNVDTDLDMNGHKITDITMSVPTTINTDVAVAGWAIAWSMAHGV